MVSISHPRPLALHRWVMAGIVFAVAAAYWSSLNGAFVFDDGPGIVDNPTLRHPGEIGRLLAPPGEQAGTVGGRPLLNLSLALNFARGGLHVEGYHALNLLIHAGSALLLFGIARGTLGDRAFWLAALIALIWALHPLQTQAVTYVIQRAESLMGLFYLLTLFCFIRGWKVAAVAACLAGMCTKEPMVSAPVLVFLYDRTFVAGSFARAWHARKGFYAALAATWVPLALLVASTHGRGGSAGFKSTAAVWPYALTQCRAIATYLHLAFWPSPLIFDYGTDLVRHPLEVAPQICLVAVLLVGTGWALWRQPVFGFLGVWFWAILAPSSSFVPIATEPMAEHRMYLPLAAVIAGTLGILAAGLERVRRGPQIGFALALVGALALGVLTARRNRDYRSDVALWADTVAKVPGNARAHNDLGTAEQARGQTTAAAEQFAAAALAAPDYAPAQFNLGVLLLNANRPAEALPHLERAQAAPRHQTELQIYLAQALVKTGRFSEAAAALRRAVAALPQRWDLHNDLANALFASGQPDAAVPEYREALRLRPGDAAIQRNLTLVLAAGRR